MAYSKAKLESNGDKAYSCFKQLLIRKFNNNNNNNNNSFLYYQCAGTTNYKAI
jgi:hypothetical protein